MITYLSNIEAGIQLLGVSASLEKKKGDFAKNSVFVPIWSKSRENLKYDSHLEGTIGFTV